MACWQSVLVQSDLQRRRPQNPGSCGPIGQQARRGESAGQVWREVWRQSWWQEWLPVAAGPETRAGLCCWPVRRAGQRGEQVSERVVQERGIEARKVAERPDSVRSEAAAYSKKGWAGRSAGACASRTSPLMNSQGHPLVSLQMCATKNAPGRGVSLSVTAP